MADTLQNIKVTENPVNISSIHAEIPKGTAVRILNLGSTVVRYAIREDQPILNNGYKCIAPFGKLGCEVLIGAGQNDVWIWATNGGEVNAELA